MGDATTVTTETVTTAEIQATRAVASSPIEAKTLKSRKILSFVLLNIGVIGLVAVTTSMHTPNEVANQALWVIGIAGLFVIGGQSLVDSITKWKNPAGSPKSDG